MLLDTTIHVSQPCSFMTYIYTGRCPLYISINVYAFAELQFPSLFLYSPVLLLRHVFKGHSCTLFNLSQFCCIRKKIVSVLHNMQDTFIVPHQIVSLTA